MHMSTQNTPQVEVLHDDRFSRPYWVRIDGHAIHGGHGRRQFSSEAAARKAAEKTIEVRRERRALATGAAIAKAGGTT